MIQQLRDTFRFPDREEREPRNVGWGGVIAAISTVGLSWWAIWMAVQTIKGL